MAEFQQGLLGCFSNCGVCIISWFLPCHTVGKVAESLEESYCYNCLCMLVPFVDLFILVTQRGKVRQKQGIDGGLLTDVLVTLCCPICSICQMGAEAEHMKGGMALDAEEAPKIERV